MLNPRWSARVVIPNLKRVLLLAVVTPLGSCMTMLGSPEPVVPDGHNFSYVAPDRERIHLTQAFDDGSKTYLQFDDTPAAGWQGCFSSSVGPWGVVNGSVIRSTAGE